MKFGYLGFNIKWRMKNEALLISVFLPFDCNFFTPVDKISNGQNLGPIKKTFGWIWPKLQFCWFMLKVFNPLYPLWCIYIPPMRHGGTVILNHQVDFQVRGQPEFWP